MEKLQRYDLLSRVGEGGMGEIFRARVCGEHGFEKLVAVKRILPELASDRDFVQRFIAEAKLAVSLSHANLVQVFDLGRSRDGLFLVMEYVEGADLAYLLHATRARKLAVPLGVVLHVAQAVLCGLTYAHERPAADGRRQAVIHCDVSPSNLMVSVAGEVKITDFGVAQVLSSARTHLPALLVGKLPYMSPEQLAGARVDEGTDLYSWAVVLYELIAGRRPFQAATAAEMVREIERGAPPLDGARKNVPAVLANLVGKCLSMRRSDRPATARALLSELAQVSRAVEPTMTLPEVGTWVRELVEPPTRAARPGFSGALRQVLRGGGAARRTSTVPGGQLGSFVASRTEAGTLVWRAATQRRPRAALRWKILAAVVGTAAGLALVGRLNWEGSPARAARAAQARASAEPRGDAPSTVEAPAPARGDALAIAEPAAGSARPVTGAGEPAPPPVTAGRRGAARAAPAPSTPASEAKHTEPAHAESAREVRSHGAAAHDRDHRHPNEPSPRDGFISVYVEPWAEVTVDGRRAGVTPLMRLPAKPGRHVVTLRGVARTRTVRVHVASRRNTLVDEDLR